MKTLSYAMASMGISSIFCIFTGKFHAFVFLSPIFSLLLTILRSKYINSISLAFPIILSASLIFYGFYELTEQFLFGYLGYIFLEALDGKVYLTPKKRISIIFHVRELRMDMAFFLIFIMALLM